MIGTAIGIVILILFSVGLSWSILSKKEEKSDKEKEIEDAPTKELKKMFMNIKDEESDEEIEITNDTFDTYEIPYESTWVLHDKENAMSDKDAKFIEKYSLLSVEEKAVIDSFINWMLSNRRE